MNEVTGIYVYLLLVLPFLPLAAIGARIDASPSHTSEKKHLGQHRGARARVRVCKTNRKHALAA